MTFLKTWGLNLVLFSIFSTVINLMVVSQKYKKYINVITGFVLVIIIINPISKIFGNRLDEFNINVINKQIKMNEKDFEIVSEDLKIKQNKMLNIAYKTNIKDHIKMLLEDYYDVEVQNIDVDMNIDNSNIKINEINLVLKLIKKDVDNIKDVSIDINNNIKDDNEFLEEKKKIKKVIKDFYKINEDNIHIIVQE